ncbi:MAG: hypothetical protein ABJB05_01230 [Parafilimonas sp.]
MQENEFEKQVKNAMEDFRLSPSASVWEKVKKNLDEKKRRIIPFIFLLIAGLIAISYFTYNVSQKQQTKSIQTIVEKNINNKIIKNNEASNKSKLNADNNNIVIPEKHDSSLSNKTKHLQYSVSLYNKEKVIKHADNDFVINDSIKPFNKKASKLSSKNHLKREIKNQNLQANDQLKVSHKKSADQSLTLHQHTKTTVDSSTTLIQKDIINDTGKIINLVKTDAYVATQNNKDNSKTFIKKLTIKYKIPNWKFGVTASYGRSSLTEKVKESNVSAPQYFTSGNNPNVSTTTPNAHPFSSSNAYSFGVVVQKKILKNAYISSGLNIIHLSAKANVNNKIDSSLIVQTSNNISSFYAVNGYYQRGSTKTVVSNYNFIEVPVNFQQYIFHSKQTSLSYNAGFSLRQLLSSNALIYNSDNDVYFSKSNFFRKTQFQLSAGLNIEINTGKYNSFFVGPQFSYSLSNLAKNANNGSLHFINYGLQAGFLLHKK